MTQKRAHYKQKTTKFITILLVSLTQNHLRDVLNGLGNYFCILPRTVFCQRKSPQTLPHGENKRTSISRNLLFIPSFLTLVAITISVPFPIVRVSGSATSRQCAEICAVIFRASTFRGSSVRSVRYDSEPGHKSSVSTSDRIYIPA